MPFPIRKAKNKTDVLDEIKRVYSGVPPAPPRVWRENNFNFKQPKDDWLLNLKAMSQLTVEMKYRNSAFDVYLVGDAEDGGKVRTIVGTIKEGN